MRTHSMLPLILFFEGLFEKNRFLDIVKNFICFNVDGQNTFKILAGYHQYFAVKKAVASTLNASLHAKTFDCRRADNITGCYCPSTNFRATSADEVKKWCSSSFDYA